MAEGIRLRAAVMFVRDLEASVAFYRELLDLEVLDRSPTAALLGSADGSQLTLRAFGENAGRPLGSIGVQYVSWSTGSRADLDRRAEILRQHSAYLETRTDQDVAVVEGRDPDDIPIMIIYAGDKWPTRKLPPRIYAW
ncbi:MAG TPA: VOC family protein [Streptosporangiaceae bacterium]|jgi:catechol-2,3-dioxygenase|nr:VOC family protein [Streptosporangiaceae bacterium]